MLQQFISPLSACSRWCVCAWKCAKRLFVSALLNCDKSLDESERAKSGTHDKNNNAHHHNRCGERKRLNTWLPPPAELDHPLRRARSRTQYSRHISHSLPAVSTAVMANFLSFWSTAFVSAPKVVQFRLLVNFHPRLDLHSHRNWAIFYKGKYFV